MIDIEYKSFESLKYWDQDKVDKYLLQNGFTRDKLQSLRSIDDNLEQLLETGKAFADLSWHDFSVCQLAMVVVDWETQKRWNVISQRLNVIYREEKDALNRQERLNTNCMQLLREETGNYYGNLREARKAWPDFVPQKNDWKKNLKIPLTIDRKVAQLLGVIWADGNFFLQKRAKNPTRITLQGRKDDKGLYESFIIPRLKDLFNYSASLELRKSIGEIAEINPRRRGLYRWQVPTIKINSTAIATWLYYDLGFHLLCNEITRDLPNLNWTDERIKQGFLEGGMASLGRLSAKDNLTFFSTKETFAGAIKELLRLNDIEFSEYERLHRLYLKRKVTLDIISRYDLINPKHRKSAEEFY